MAAKKIGRSAITGRFMSVKSAKRRPRTSVVETLGSKPTKPKKK